MNLNLFHSFSVLAKERNMTRAANKLGITQQALSAQIARLEKHYQTQLFSRAPSFNLTYAGQRLLAFCGQLENWSSRISDELQEIRDGEREQIFIGATAKRSYTIIPQIFPLFHAEYPHVEICIVESTSQELFQNVLDRKTDFCIVVSDPNDSQIQTIPISDEQTLLFISDHALRKYCPDHYEYLVSNKDLNMPITYFANCPFILNSPGNRVREKCDALFESYNIVPNIIFSSANAMNLAAIVSTGIGATFLNSSTTPEAVHGLHRFKIQILSTPKVLKVAYLRNRHLSRATQRWIEIMTEQLPKSTVLPQGIIGLW